MLFWLTAVRLADIMKYVKKMLRNFGNFMTNVEPDWRENTVPKEEGILGEA